MRPKKTAPRDDVSRMLDPAFYSTVQFSLESVTKANFTTHNGSWLTPQRTKQTCGAKTGADASTSDWTPGLHLVQAMAPPPWSALRFSSLSCHVFGTPENIIAVQEVPSAAMPLDGRTLLLLTLSTKVDGSSSTCSGKKTATATTRPPRTHAILSQTTSPVWT
jgi:hypothetical protein